MTVLSSILTLILACLTPLIAQPVFKSIPAQGITNVFQLSPSIFSGSVPEGEIGFSQLQKLGIKTAVSVDGLKPNLELAHKFGIQYVHIPHGYDGISTNVEAQLIKAAQISAGPIFVHCHHGQHRGPTAAAIICMGTEGWSPFQATAWLKTAGTATNYPGLYETVANFRKPSAEILAAISSSFPEVAKISGLVDAMVSIDDTWEHLKGVRNAGYLATKVHPDIRPSREMVILREHFREAQRLPESMTQGKDFTAKLKAAEEWAAKSEPLLNQFASKQDADIRIRLDNHFDALGRSCKECHAQFRDTRSEKLMRDP